MAEEATAPSAGDNMTCSNGRCGEDKYGSGEEIRARDRVSFKTGSLCYGGRLREKLLCLWRFWAHGLPLQEQRKREANGRKEDKVQ